MKKKNSVNMNLDRLPRTRYFSGRGQAQRSARANLEIIMNNINDLASLRNGKKLIEAAKNMNAQKEPLSSNQISYIENIYEKVFISKGFEGAEVHHDKKKTLRF